MKKIKMHFCKKGFIGPIGDDLPSLVPIMISLLLFFSIFSLTLNIYDTQNIAIRKQITMISVARSLKGDSLITDYTSFNDKCDWIKEKKYPHSFMVAIYPATGNFDTVIQDFVDAGRGDFSADNFLQGKDEFDADQPYFCKYRKLGSLEFSEKRAKYSELTFPIAVQREREIGGEDYYIIEPAVMQIEVWD
ncbi:MAG: hypothetical protein HOE11_04895 [Candidatus Diapherotrites archaeon]|nr:hypothetical protein [Candidatus Diapherotrites archaeon]MBT4596976.1 hypothetical protein [Candidatus Diapherotrites archaeon]